MLIVLTLVIVAIPVFRHINVVHDLKEQGIYLLAKTPPEFIENRDETWQSTYYMICEPSADDAELTKQIETFIEENGIVAQLEQELTETWGASLEDTVLKIVFVQPNTSYPIGKFPREGSTFDERFVDKIATCRYLNHEYQRLFIVPYR